MNIEALNKLKDVDIRTVNPDTLVDIKTVYIDHQLSKNDRILQFITQIKNPYVHLCGDIIVKNSFSNTELTLEDSFKNYLKKFT